MLEAGTRIEFHAEKDAVPERGTVVSCNRRGTSCAVELRPGERRTINLHKIEYAVLGDGFGDDEAAPSASGELSAGETSSDRDELGHSSAWSHISPQKRTRSSHALSRIKRKVQNRSAGPDEGTGDNEGASDGGEGDDEDAVDAFDAETATSVDAFRDVASRPEDFAGPSVEYAGLARLAAKALYDYTQATPLASQDQQSSGLTELHVDGFDAEQIWGQLELTCGGILRKLRKRISKLPSELELVDQETEAMLDELMQQLDGGGAVGAAEADSDEGDPTDLDGPEALDDADEDDEDLAADLPSKPSREKKLREGLAPSTARAARAEELLPTEDEHFRLGEMEAFVQRAEEEASKAWAQEAESGSSGGESDDSEEEEEDGLFELEAAAEESNSDEEDAELARLLESATAAVGKAAPGKSKGGKKSTAEGNADAIMYEDFFGPSGQEEDRDDDEDDREEAKLPNDGDLDDDSLSRSFDEEDQEHDDDDDDSLGGEEKGQPHGTDEAAADPPAGLSAHERRMMRMAERARKLEAENIGEKEWYMRGEAGAASRPLNSALEVDLDFERAVQPPPEPTESTTGDLEALIKRRITDAAFDDPRRLAPPPDDLQRDLAELDDKKASKGLGEVYEEDYVRAKTGNALADKDEKPRAEARLVLKELFAKLDALSHFHFAPKPIIKEPTIQREVPALAMEEVAPQVVSEAARQLPEEVYKPSKESKDKALLTPAEKRTRRAAKKRGFKKRKAQEAEEAGERRKALQAAGNIVGRKSDAAESEAAAAAKKARKKRKRGGSADASGGPKMNFTKSSAVFGKLQDEREGKVAKIAPETTRKSSSFKL